MKLPAIRGIIDRRILVNYRVEADVLSQFLPPPFRPKLVAGKGMAGICLIRLKKIRPGFLPAWCGISSENAAHRVAVEWDDDAGKCSGVYVRRRDTNSWLNTMAGGRLFPGVHHRAKFDVAEDNKNLSVAMRSYDGQVALSIRCHRVPDLSSSVFDSLDQASQFFEQGSIGFSDCCDPLRFQGMELRCHHWSIVPLDVDEVHSSLFDDTSIFPAGSIRFDCAVLMEGIDHHWVSQPDLYRPEAGCSRHANTIPESVARASEWPCTPT